MNVRYKTLGYDVQLLLRLKIAWSGRVPNTAKKVGYNTHRLGYKDSNFVPGPFRFRPLYVYKNIYRTYFSLVADQ